MIKKAIKNRDELTTFLFSKAYTLKPRQSTGEYTIKKYGKKIGILCLAGTHLEIYF